MLVLHFNLVEKYSTMGPCYHKMLACLSALAVKQYSYLLFLANFLEEQMQIVRETLALHLNRITSRNHAVYTE